MKRLLLLTAALGAAPVFGHATLAADVDQDRCGTPCFEYSGYAELNSDWLFPKDSAEENSQDLYPKSEIEMVVTPFEGFSILTNIVTEPVIDAEPGKDSNFSDVGTYIEILQAQIDLGDLTFFAGKIHPAFGRAWDIAPGLHGTDLAETYELSERLGGGVSFGFEGLGMSNVVSLSAFTADRTVLSESLFTNRGRLSLDDGGAGNTAGIASVAAAIEGCLGADGDKCYEEGNFGYQLAARYQKGGQDSEGDEIGLLGSVNKSFEIVDDARLVLLGEAAWFEHFDGGDDNAVAVTGSAALVTGPFIYSGSYTQIRTLVADGGNEKEQLFDASASYALGDFISALGEQWSVGAGYTWTEQEDESTQVLGLRLRADFEGSTSLSN